MVTTGLLCFLQFFSIVLILLFIGLAIWVILFLVFKWNDKVIRETTSGAAPDIPK